MKNIDVINSFFSKNPNETTNVKSNAYMLYSYDTCIAEWHGVQLLINTTKYSATTSRHQNMFQKELLKRARRGIIFEIITKNNVPRGTYRLSNI